MDREQGHDEERNPAQQRVWVLDAVHTWGVMLNEAGVLGACGFDWRTAEQGPLRPNRADN